MKREWKPGDVALVEVPKSTLPRHGVDERGRETIRVSRWSDGWALLTDPDYFWRDGYAFFGGEGPRPLVVIDPEDREQIERLAKGLPLEWDLFQADDPDVGEETVAAMQAALREFADPKPRIEEPTGLGAVVVNAAGEPFVGHDMADGDESQRVWCDSSGVAHPWSHVAAVRVLSLGVEVDQ